jgi:hypothetical protein
MRIVNIIILVLLIGTFPVVFLGIVFGLAGSTSQYFIVMASGYFIGILFSFLGLFWQKFAYIGLSGFLMIVVGFTLNGVFWLNHNRNLCEELRAETSCIESELGFSCSNFKGGKFGTEISICD